MPLPSSLKEPLFMHTSGVIVLLMYMYRKTTADTLTFGAQPAHVHVLGLISNHTAT